MGRSSSSALGVDGAAAFLPEATSNPLWAARDVLTRAADTSRSELLDACAYLKVHGDVLDYRRAEVMEQALRLTVAQGTRPAPPRRFWQIVRSVALADVVGGLALLFICGGVILIAHGVSQ